MVVKRPFQNYTQRPLDGSLGRGALGQGHQAATALATFFSLWCYRGRSKRWLRRIILTEHLVTPLVGAIIADQSSGSSGILPTMGIAQGNPVRNA
jgi:POT family proton-dependent oligopeptide transporter